MSNELVDMPMDISIHEAGGLLEVANKAEQLIAAIKKIKQVVLAVTNQQDWIDENGRPYLQASGAEKVRPIFGIEWEIDPTPEIIPMDNGHSTYKYHGTFSMAGKRVSIIGSRSSNDPLFSRAHGADIPIDKILMANVDKSAYTNTIGNGVTRILGIRNMTWEELEAAGIQRHKSGAVDRSGTKIPRTPKYGPEPDVPITECSTEHLQAYAESLDRSLTIDDPLEIFPTDAPEEKRKKQKHNDGVAKKLKFKDKNERDLEAIIAELEARTAKAAQVATPTEDQG